MAYPFSAKVSAMAAPIPREPPVTSARFPFSSVIIRPALRADNELSECAQRYRRSQG